jgi:hypothetical protein
VLQVDDYGIGHSLAFRFRVNLLNLWRLNYQLSIVPRLPLPTGLKQFAQLETGEWMSLSTNYYLIQGQQIIGRE